MKIIDLRRDTITRPNKKMREMAFAADLGDSVYGEDPEHQALEQQAAEKLGKEASLFLPSGTMGNLTAVLTHTRRGDEIILEKNAHIRTSETGGAAAVGGLSINTVPGPYGLPDPAGVENAVRADNIHYPRTGLVCGEMSHYRYGGIVAPLPGLKELYTLCRKKQIPLHLDGARIFNAALYLGVDVREITKHTDSVMVSLSKGLGAPVGSMLCGTADFIEKAKRYRKMLGGGMRQTGWLCACGREALSDENIALLKIDHANAKKLALGLNSIEGFSVDMERVHTNYVVAETAFSQEQLASLTAYAEGRSVLLNPPRGGTLRFVISREVTDRDIDSALQVIDNFTKEAKAD